MGSWSLSTGATTGPELKTGTGLRLAMMESTGIRWPMEPTMGISGVWLPCLGICCCQVALDLSSPLWILLDLGLSSVAGALLARGVVGLGGAGGVAVLGVGGVVGGVLGGVREARATGGPSM